MIIKIGTRESKLAMIQAEMLIKRIKLFFPEAECVLCPYKTSGDRFLDSRLESAGGKGLFVKEIEEDLLEGKIDAAVHSAKDVPAFLPDGLILISALPRANVEDVFISKYEDIMQLPEGAVVGTSSPRREAVLRELRPDVKNKLLRGNVLSRLEKYDKGEYDGIILAKAGIDRLDIIRDDIHIIPVDTLIPASGQGTIVVEVSACGQYNELFAEINDEKSFYCLSAERCFLKELNGGCSDPMASYAVIDGEKMIMRAMLEKNGKLVYGSLEGLVSDREKIGINLAKTLSGGDLI